MHRLIPGVVPTLCTQHAAESTRYPQEVWITRLREGRPASSVTWYPLQAEPGIGWGSRRTSGTTSSAESAASGQPMRRIPLGEFAPRGVCRAVRYGKGNRVLGIRGF
ncbi:hypothetical protein ACFFX0_16935 [Citricoccus parietis]|uniref:Uncharacterized protein n=1 Tax=Citricoccus parietis TaxID=592307 RepID=A0ABV5G1H7_9MICC